MSESVKARLQGLYGSVLDGRMGLRVSLDSDGDLIVETAQGPVLVDIPVDDPGYLRLSAAFGGEGFDVLAPEQVGEICARVTAQVKVVKVVPVDGGTLVAAEMVVAAPGLLPTADHLTAVLPRALGMVEAAAARVVEELQFAAIAATNDM